MRISHLATERSVARSLVAHRNQFGEYKNGSFSSHTEPQVSSTFLCSRPCIHVQGYFDNNASIPRSYPRYFSNLSNVSLSLPSLSCSFHGNIRVYIVVFVYFHNRIIENIQSPYIASILVIPFILSFAMLKLTKLTTGNLNSVRSKFPPRFPD